MQDPDQIAEMKRNQSSVSKIKSSDSLANLINIEIGMMRGVEVTDEAKNTNSNEAKEEEKELTKEEIDAKNKAVPVDWTRLATLARPQLPYFIVGCIASAASGLVRSSYADIYRRVAASSIF